MVHESTVKDDFTEEKILELALQNEEDFDGLRKGKANYRNQKKDLHRCRGTKEQILGKGHVNFDGGYLG